MTFSDQEQVGKPIKIGVAWARQDGLGGGEGHVEDVESRLALKKISNRNAHVVLSSI